MTPSLRQRAYEHIREGTLAGVFEPGARLSIRRLARQINISAIPVREALTQLVSEGLLEHKPGVGVFVVQLTPEELAELCDLREALECHAIRKAAPVADEVLLDELHRQKSVMEDVIRKLVQADAGDELLHVRSDFTLADAQFHMAILKAAGNRRTLKILSDLRVLTHSLSHRDRTPTIEQLLRVDAEHGRVLDALVAHDPAAAEQALAHHLAQATRASMDALQRRRMEMGHGAGVGIQDQLHALERSASEMPPED